MMFCTRKTVLNLSRHRFSTKSIVVSDHVKSAIANREPVVALESTIITHGMPRPHNLESAKKVQKIIENEVSSQIVKNSIIFSNPKIRQMVLTFKLLKTV